MRFVPLAMSKMGEHGTCVAGVDLDSGQWIRPVVSGHSCLFEEQTTQFKANHIHDLVVGATLTPSPDASTYHTEDRVFIRVNRVGEQLSPGGKLNLLRSFASGSLASSLFAGGSSLYLIEPEDVAYKLDQYGEKRRFHLSGFPPPQEWTAALEERLIGISVSGIPCTCPRWKAFSQENWLDKAVTLAMIRDYTDGANVFLVVSLGRLYKEKHWVMVAGVHIVGDDRIWL